MLTENDYVPVSVHSVKHSQSKRILHRPSLTLLNIILTVLYRKYLTNVGYRKRIVSIYLYSQGLGSVSYTYESVFSHVKV